LLVEGEDLEFDTQILDSLAEPLLHLLRNAVAHGIESPETRRLLGKGEFGKIFLSVSKDESHINLTVSDDGRGISAASLIEKAVQNNFITAAEAGKMSEQEAFALVFLPGLTTAEKLSQVAGRGVGMNIVKTAVARAGGEISVHSKPQKGTIFKIRLPIVSSLKLVKTAAESAPKTKERASEDPGRILSVMIVDDSPGMSLGFEAMEILQGSVNPPDVILSDVEMPRMSGFELLQFIKQRESLKGIPVIMITSRDSTSDRQKGFELGASEYLTKPYEDARLLELIRKLSA
jgi:CheY-like chemotaxis protein